MWDWIYPELGIDVSVHDIIMNSSLEYWQEAPVYSVIENSEMAIQSALDSRISRAFGSYTVGVFSPADFAGISPQYMGTNRQEILADVFNANADVIMEMFDELTIWNFLDDDDEFGDDGGGGDGWCW